MKHSYRVEDLGVQAHSDVWLGFRLGKNPKTGSEVVIGSLSRGGFMVIDPVAKKGIQARPERPYVNGGWWAIWQAPDGSIYQ